MGTEQKGIDLCFECEENVPELLKVDVSRLKQVIINLMQNALKFTMKGHILLSLKFWPNNSYLTVKVSDTGIGIPQ